MNTLRNGLLFAAGLLTSMVSMTAHADDPQFAFPVDCTIGADCFIQLYVDHDPGPGVSDYTCGSLAYDGHDGTDIRSLTLADIYAGIAVLAAAPGVVKATRNHMPDIAVGHLGSEVIADKMAGNAVVIDHGNGWETQYSHLLMGSVVVSLGMRVESGDVIGAMGLSGSTSYPHIEFTIRHDGQPIDPFTGLSADSECGKIDEVLWDESTAATLAYIPGSLVASGFGGGEIYGAAMRFGAYDSFVLTDHTDALVFWADAFGVQEGDRLVVKLALPDGSDPVVNSVEIDRNRPLHFAYTGKKRPEDGWPSGSYSGDAQLIRSINGVEQIISTMSATFAYP